MAALTAVAVGAPPAMAEIPPPTALSARDASVEAPLRRTTTGFYPIWENTGNIERHRELYLGTNGMQFGILNRFHLGIQPVHFLYRAPNAYIKVSLYDGERLQVATQLEALDLMDQAGRASLSPMYVSRLDNVGYSVFLAPLSFAVTYQVGDWLDFHQNVTALPLFTSGPLKNETTFGYSAVAEFNGRGRHGACLHFTEVGLWNHDFSMLGVSYRYRNTWMEARLGYFYRFRAAGTQSAPLISFGLLL